MAKQKEEIKLSDHFDYARLIRFTLPSIGMMVFTSIYGVVDGIFVSNFAGDTAFAAINLIMPFLMVFSAVGMMVGAGGTALVSMKLGEQKPEEAKQIFSQLVYLVVLISLVLTVVGEITLPQVASFLGADENMMPYCIVYGRIIMAAMIPFMLQAMFQTFLVAAEKPRLGLVITVAAGVSNMILDAVLVGALNLGVVGAAAATTVSQCVGGLIPLVYFIAPNKSLLRLTKPYPHLSSFWKACGNGASEFMSNVSMSVVNMVYNFQLMRLIGQDGVTAYGVIMYVCFIFLAIFFGYGMGGAPIVGYHYGANNTDELKNLLKRSTIIIGVVAVAMTIAAELLAMPLARIFVGYREDLLALTVRAFRIYSISYLLSGFNVYASSFFTALNNGAVSAIISFARTFFFQIVAVLVLPIFFGIDGIWFAIAVAEVFSMAVCIFFFAKNKNRYHYM